MSNIPSEIKYTKTHEWVRLEDDNIATVGITAHAQELLGELVYVELPEIGRTVIQGEEASVVESVKAAADVYSPVSGEIIEINTQLSHAPELVNEDSYLEGWLYKIALSHPEEIENLFDAEDYRELILTD
jgi:glycine cleavage system H protein